MGLRGRGGGGGVYSLANYIAVFEAICFKTDSPILFLLCVLYFQKQPFTF